MPYENRPYPHGYGLCFSVTGIPAQTYVSGGMLESEGGQLRPARLPGRKDWLLGWKGSYAGAEGHLAMRLRGMARSKRRYRNDT